LSDATSISDLYVLPNGAEDDLPVELLTTNSGFTLRTINFNSTYPSTLYNFVIGLGINGDIEDQNVSLVNIGVISFHVIEIHNVMSSFFWLLY
jgi:hypothetical protein